MQCSLHTGSVVRICSDRKTSSSTCNPQRLQLLSRPANRYQPGPTHPAQQFRCHSTAESAPPAADNKDGRESYQPESFSELIDDACKAISRTIEAGYNRVEVEFPPLSSEGGTSFKSSDSYIDANVQFAIAAAKQLKAGGIERIHLLTPEKGEFRRTYGMFKPALESFKDTITMGYLQEARKGFFQFLVTADEDTSVAPPGESAKQADVFIAINATSADLPALEQYAAGPAANKPLILWNLELDTLRSDLGLPGFPGKAVQYRFLSTVKPAFYIRQRDYSKSVPQPPYIVNYSGCLFREFPGPWQVMLKEGNKYVAVADRDERFDLGEVKNELLQAMGLNTEAPGSVFSFLRTGYKTTTWWEDDRDKEESAVWRQ